MDSEGDMVFMVKPQFEVGKERVGKGGVVRDAKLRSQAVTAVAEAAAGIGWGAQGVSTSQLPGPSGNIEYFLWLRLSSESIGATEIECEVARTDRLGVLDEKVVP